MAIEEVYSMEIMLKNKPRILTIAVSDKSMVVTLTDLQGNEIETYMQQGNKISVTQTSK